MTRRTLASGSPVLTAAAWLAALAFAAAEPKPEPPGTPPQAPTDAPAPPSAPAPALAPAPPEPREAPRPDGPIPFNLKDVSIDNLLKYVSKEIGVTIVKEVKVEGTVTAVSAEGVPPDRVLSFVDSVLKPKGVTTLRIGDIVKIVDVDEAKRRNIQIFVGSDPDKITPSDTVITQVIPLKYALAADIQKELAVVLAKTGELASNARSNTLVFTDTAANVHRFVRIIREIDRQLVDAARIRVYFLKFSDARVVANILNEIFGKNERTRARQSGFGSPLQFLFGGGGRGSESGKGPTDKEATPHMEVQIAADPRTNSVTVIASDDYHAIVQEVVDRLDVQMSDLLQVRVYMLQHADAQETVRIVKDIFKTETTSTPGAGGGQGGGGGSTPQERFSRFFGTGARAMAETPQGRFLPNQHLDITADPRTNSVIVAASKEYQDLVKEIVVQLDAQIANLLKIRPYRLKNADAVQTADIIRATFRPTPARTSGGSARPGGGAGAAGTSSMIPSEMLEVSADARTNTLIIKGTEDSLREIDKLVKQLDEDATEQVTTFVYPLKNANSGNVAGVLGQLLHGTGAASAPASSSRTSGSSRSSSGASGSSGSGSTGPSLGGTSRSGSAPRMAADPPAPGGASDPDTATANPEEEPEKSGPRSSVVGDIDIRADPDSNAVLIRTTPRNVAAVRRLLDDLDRVRPQVLIKVLIAEVTLDDTLRFGVEGFWENGILKTNDSAIQHIGTDFPGIASTLAEAGFTYRLTGDEFDYLLQTLNRNHRLQVLATPRILALANERANITVGSDIPEVVNTRLTDQGTTLNTIQRREVGILLQVTPQVNPDGLVTMTVHPEISDLSKSKEVKISEGVTSPVIERNSADTTVAVAHGQTVVIGGLIREAEETTVNSLPLLGDIPLLGALFRHEEHVKEKRELMIFLTPYVVNRVEDLKEMTRLEQAQLKLIKPSDVLQSNPSWEFEPRE